MACSAGLKICPLASPFLPGSRSDDSQTCTVFGEPFVFHRASLPRRQFGSQIGCTIGSEFGYTDLKLDHHFLQWPEAMRLIVDSDAVRSKTHSLCEGGPLVFSHMPQAGAFGLYVYLLVRSSFECGSCRRISHAYSWPGIVWCRCGTRAPSAWFLSRLSSLWSFSSFWPSVSLFLTCSG